jgi:GxxExxY protein
MELMHADVTEQIIGATFEVYRELGYGFLESVYQNAMLVELGLRGIAAMKEEPIKVRYKGVPAGDYRGDFFVAECVMVELKVEKEYNSKDEPQILNELKGTGVKVGMLIKRF